MAKAASSIRPSLRADSAPDGAIPVAAGSDGVAVAAALLKDGALVILPTETVYGLAARADDSCAVARVYAAKRRPAANPLIIHIARKAQAHHLACVTETAEKLMDAFWPGPLTLVLQKREDSNLAPNANGGLTTIALRLPRHPLTRAVLARCAFPLAMPSANLSERLSPTTAEDAVRAMEGAAALALDGGKCALGIESTILSLATPRPRLLRAGAVSAEAIAKVVKVMDDDSHALAKDMNHLAAPGRMARHYAPRTPLRLNAHAFKDDEGALLFGRNTPPGGALRLNLSRNGDLEEAAANLYAMLRRLDDAAPRAIAVVPLPKDGIGAALCDRLRRAAGGKARA